MSKIDDLRPVPAFRKTTVGLYEEDCRRIGAKERDWVSIEYDQKKASGQVTVMDQKTGWEDKVVWVPLKQMSSLRIEKEIEDKTPDNPANFTVSVKKLSFPRSNKLYIAILTLVLTILGVIFQAGMLIWEEQELIFGISYGIVLILGPLFAAIMVYMQKQ